MYDRDGRPVEVPLGEVAAAARSGRYGFADGQTVHVADPSAGGIVPMSGAAAAAFFSSSQSYGTEAAHGSDYEAQERRKQLETVGHEAAALGLGAARGLTLGASDYVASEAGGDRVRKYLADQQRINPGLSATGEVAGMLAPALATGGASAEASLGLRGARAATALPRGVMATGEAAGALAERGAVALGAESSGRLAGAARVLAQNATEGGLYGVGQAVSEASVKDEPITVEKLLAAGGHGALAGAALGGALHGSLSLGKMGVAKAGTAIKDGATSLGEAAREKLVNKIADAVGEGATRGGDAVAGKVAGEAGAGAKAAEGLSDFDAAKEKIRGFLGAASKGDVEAMERIGNDELAKRTAQQIGIDTTGKTTAELYATIADKQSVSSLVGTSERAQKKLDKLTKDAHAMLPELIENDLRAAAGLQRGATMSRELMSETAPKLKTAAGEQMEAILKRFDDAAAGDAAKLPSLRTAAERIDAEISAPLLAEARTTLGPGTSRGIDGGTRKGIVADLEEYLSEYRKTGTVSHKDMHQIRKYLDEKINFDAKSAADKIRSRAFRDARDILDEELVKAGDRAQGLTGGESALEWQAAKNKWAASNVIAENAARGASKDSKNRVFGLSEQLGASRGGALGTAVGSALGSIVPVFGTAAGGLAGGLLGSHLGAYGAGMTRRYGDQVVARIAREASQAGADGAIRGALREADKALDSKLGSYLGGKGVEAAAAAKNKIPGAVSQLEDLLGGSVSQVGARPASAGTGAAEAASSSRVASAQAKLESLEAQAAQAGPGQVRRALVDKIARAKDAVAAAKEKVSAKVDAAAAKAKEVQKALPGAGAIVAEANRVQNRAAAQREDEFRAKRQQYADLASSPREIQQATAAIRSVRPDMAKSLEAKLTEIANYVNGKAPVSTRVGGTLTPSTVREAVSPSQMREFLQVAKAAEDPLSILDDLAAGRLSSAQVRTVKDLYPQLHAEIVSRVVDKLADSPPLPYQQRLEIGLLLGAPTDASLRPAFIQSVQQTFTAPQPSPPAPAALLQREFSGASSLATKMQEVEKGAD